MSLTVSSVLGRAVTPTSSFTATSNSLPTAPSFVSPAPFPSLSFFWVILCLGLLFLCRTGCKYIEKDYKSFLALGPGGTPSSFAGYTRLSLISVLKLRDPLFAPELPARLRPQVGFLTALPARQGNRPQLAGIAPQRQMSQNPSPDMLQMLKDTIYGLAQQCPSHWYVAKSAFEKHNDALFSKFKTFTEPDYYGEIVHAHADGSMHLTLHPEDVRTVLNQGWGERHPLARGKTWWWNSPVPCGFMIVYGPRNRAELHQIKKIIRAAACWVSGVDGRTNMPAVKQASSLKMNLLPSSPLSAIFSPTESACSAHEETEKWLGVCTPTRFS